MAPALRQQLVEASICAPVLLVPESLPVAHVIEEILLLNEYSVEADWAPGVLYLPLR